MDFKPPDNFDANDCSSWPKWRQKFNIFLKASGKYKNEDEDTKIALLLHAMGDSGIDIYNTFPEIKTKMLADVIQCFDEYFVPKENVTMETFKFNNITQRDGQTIDTFITELKNQAEKCDFICTNEACKQSYIDRMIRDRIILGIKDNQVQQRLLRANMSITKIQDYCKSIELSKEHLKLVIPESSTQEVKDEYETGNGEEKQEQVNLKDIQPSSSPFAQNSLAFDQPHGNIFVRSTLGSTHNNSQALPKTPPFAQSNIFPEIFPAQRITRQETPVFGTPIQNISLLPTLRQLHSPFGDVSTITTTSSHTDVDTADLVKAVVDDMMQVEKGGQWLFSCYAPFRNKPAFSGFSDQSFEEVRLGYYKAQNNGTVEQYKQQLKVMRQEIMTKVKALQKPSPDNISMVKLIYNAPSSSCSGVFGSNNTSATVFGNTGWHQ